MRVTHVITRLVVGGAQENTLATIRGLRQIPGLEVRLITGPTIGPEGSLAGEAAAMPDLLTTVPELVRPVQPLKDFVALRKLENLLREQNRTLFTRTAARLEYSDVSPPGAPASPSSFITSTARRSAIFKARWPTSFSPPRNATPPRSPTTFFARPAP